VAFLMFYLAGESAPRIRRNRFLHVDFVSLPRDARTTQHREDCGNARRSLRPCPPRTRWGIRTRCSRPVLRDTPSHLVRAERPLEGALACALRKAEAFSASTSVQDVFHDKDGRPSMRDRRGPCSSLLHPGVHPLAVTRYGNECRRNFAASSRSRIRRGISRKPFSTPIRCMGLFREFRRISWAICRTRSGCLVRDNTE